MKHKTKMQKQNEKYTNADKVKSKLDNNLLSHIIYTYPRFNKCKHCVNTPVKGCAGKSCVSGIFEWLEKECIK